MATVFFFISPCQIPIEDKFQSFWYILFVHWISLNFEDKSRKYYDFAGLNSHSRMNKIWFCERFFFHGCWSQWRGKMMAIYIYILNAMTFLYFAGLKNFLWEHFSMIIMSNFFSQFQLWICNKVNTETFSIPKTKWLWDKKSRFGVSQQSTWFACHFVFILIKFK